MFDFHMTNLVYKSQWVERSLPKYITLRLGDALALELANGDFFAQLSKTATVIDIIYAFAKNARWHKSKCFLQALAVQIQARYNFRCPQTMELAADLLGNTTTLDPEVERCFLISYFSAWHDFSFPESSERFCGLSRDWYEGLQRAENQGVPLEAFEILHWFRELQGSKILWQADEAKIQLEAGSSFDHRALPGDVFTLLFRELEDSKSKPELSDKLQKFEKAGLVFRLEEENLPFSLSIDAQKLTARFAVSQSSSLTLPEFLSWCEPWQRCFLQSRSAQRKFILSELLQSGSLPKMSVLGEFIACLEEELGEDCARSYLIEALSSQSSHWQRAALLAAGRHLLDQDFLYKTAASLLEQPSDEIQRLAADVIFF